MSLPLTKNAWDSPKEALLFLLGAFLCVGLFSFFVHGIREFHFLSKNTGQNFLTEVSGVVGSVIPYTYYGNGNTGARTFYYYPLYQTSESKVPKVIVRHDQSLQFFLQENIDMLPQKGDVVVIHGVSGIEKIPSEVKKQIENINDVPLLLSNVKPPEIKILLMWFIPVSIGFFLGIFFLFRWLNLVIQQVYLSKKV